MRAIDARAMELASSDRELKAALFRFVDVVPACRSLDDLARHLRGFLEEVPDASMPIAAAMKISDTRAGRTALGAAAASGVKHMAHRFIVGETPKSALGVLRGLWDRGVASSVDLLGEATVTQAEADRYAERCADALEQLARAAVKWPARPVLEHDTAGPLPRANVSVKVSALTPLLRPDAPERGRRDAAARLRPLLARAQRTRRAHPHRHGVAGLARGGARARARAALRGAVPHRSVCRDRAPGLPARLTGARGADPRLGGRLAADPAAHRAARQGRLLGPRARAGAPARLADPGVRGQGRVRPQLRGADRDATRRPARRARRGRLPQPALGRARDRRQPAVGRRRSATSSSRCCAGSATSSRTRSPPAASACARTARSATSSPGWPTSCGACSRTPATSRSSPSRRAAAPLDVLLAAP